jgi:hypothetical protein
MFSRINTRLARALIGTLLVTATLLGSPPHATAQSSVVMIVGTVKGPNGAILGGAIVAATSVDAQTRTTKANESGQYRIIFPNGGSAFRVTVKATGYLPWTGDVKKAYNDDRIVADVTLRAGGTPADWPAATTASLALTFERGQLGAADALDIAVDAADLGVIGTASDQISYKTYRVEAPAGPDSIRGLSAIPETGTHTFGPGGLSIRPADGVYIVVSVPRTLAHLKITVTHEGKVRVSNFDGELRIRSAAGPVRVDGIAGPTLVEAQDGAISGSLGVIPSTMNFLGRNGNITLTLPTDARASLATEVHQGLIYHDSTSRVVTPPRFTIPAPDGLEAYLEAHRVGMPEAFSGTRSTWILNGGGAAITVTSLNGNIIIRKTPPKQE